MMKQSSIKDRTSKEVNMIRHVFLDMDCVLSDLVAGIATEFGTTKADLLNHWTPGVYGWASPVRDLQRRRFPDATHWKEVSLLAVDEMIWRRLDARSEFWLDLPILPWAHELVEVAERHDPDFRFLTSPSDCGYCLIGKHQWLEKHFGKKYSRRLMPVATVRGQKVGKSLLAAPDRLLVDDHEENVTAWADRKGVGVLFPAHHNSLHTYSSEGEEWDHVWLQLRALLQGSAT